MSWYGGWAPYVPVARRRAQANKFAQKVAKKRGKPLNPVSSSGRNIATTFWGRAWCDNLEAYSDFANRLPRGRTYLRNGSVIDLQINPGEVTAFVSGSEVYTVRVAIERLKKAAWARISRDCAQEIFSLLDLLQGRFSDGVMRRLTRPADGLFPKPSEIKLSCSCPDSAWLCKHLAATMYGVGALLDRQPELLFTLRAVDHLELVRDAAQSESLDQALAGGSANAIPAGELSEVFGIEFDSAAAPKENSPNPRAPRRKRSKRAAAPTAVAGTSDAPRKAAKAKGAPTKEVRRGRKAVASNVTAVEVTPPRGRRVAK